MATVPCIEPAISLSTTSFLHSPLTPSPLLSPKPYRNPQICGTRNPQIFPPTLTRRLFLPSVSGIWDAVTGGNSAREAVLAVRRGMLAFRQGDVLGSLAEFDKAMELDPRQKAYLWQRGLSLYYLDRFEEGAEQFRFDVAQNPNDTEESIWCFLCEARLFGVDEARRRFLELVAVFSSRGSEFFYASLYAGLYYESEGKVDGARFHILAASRSSYGLRSDDYMAALAKVHCQCRSWSSD